MSRNKSALLCIKSALEKYTDENHGLGTAELVGILAKEQGVTIGRKSVYDSVQALIDAGYDIAITRGRGSKYKMLSKGYDIAELKLIIDSISAATFLSEKKAALLIEKVQSLTSIHNAEQLTEGLTLRSTVRTDNEKVYYVLDAVNTAILTNKQITFKYFDYECVASLKRIAKNGGKLYEVSPFRLVVKNDKYYLIGNSKKRKGLSIFRVDRIEEVSISDVKRNMRTAENVDFDSYIKNNFDMFVDEDYPVVIKAEFANALLKVVVDRFGKDVSYFPKGDTFIVEATVRSKKTFYSWLINFGASAKLLAPQEMVYDFKMTLNEILKVY